MRQSKCIENILSDMEDLFPDVSFKFKNLSEYVNQEQLFTVRQITVRHISSLKEMFLELVFGEDGRNVGALVMQSQGFTGREVTRIMDTFMDLLD